MAQPIRYVVLDFDGTFTQVDKEGAPFYARYRACIDDLVGRCVADEWAAAEREIQQNPLTTGWDVAGKLMAPAIVDPYVMASAVATRVLTRVGLLRDAQNRSAILQAIYKYAYDFSDEVFKPVARELLGTLMAMDGLEVVVITNSATDTVTKKIQALGLAKMPQVIGSARKFELAAPMNTDPAFEALHPLKLVPGFEGRVLYVKRGAYFDALRKVWGEEPVETAAPATLVCGDVYELDCLLPGELGAQVHLVERKNTLDFERTAVKGLGHGRGTVGALEEVLERVVPRKGGLKAVGSRNAARRAGR